MIVPTARDADGMEQLRKWFNAFGAIRLLFARCETLTVGRSTLSCTPPEQARNPNGAVNGALIAAVVDVAGGIAVASLDEDAGQSATSDLSLHFLAPAMTTPLTFEGRVLRRGRRNCVVEVHVSDADGTLCTVATGTWVLTAAAASRD